MASQQLKLIRGEIAMDPLLVDGCVAAEPESGAIFAHCDRPLRRKTGKNYGNLAETD